MPKSGGTLNAGPCWADLGLRGIYHESEGTYAGAGAGSSPAGSADFGGAGSGTAAAGGAAPADGAGVNAGGQQQSQHVPYDRFQQVNTQYQQVNSRVSQLDAQAQALGYANADEYFAAAQAPGAAGGYGDGQGYGQADPYGGYGQADPGQVDPSQFHQMQDALANVLFEQQFSQMAGQFPMADKAAVRALMLSGQSRSLGHAMQTSHQAREADRQRFIAEYQQNNQQRQDAGAEGAGGGVASGGVDYGNMSREEFQKHLKRVKGY